MKVFLLGFMGSGKSHWGKQLSERLGMRFFDLDQEIVNSEEKSITDIFSMHGEEYFRLKEMEVLHILTESHPTFIMACGGGTPCYFNNIEYMNQEGSTIWLNTPLKTLYTRLLIEREQRPLLRELTDQQLKNFISKKFADRKIYYEQAHIFIEDEEITLDKFIEKVFHA